MAVQRSTWWSDRRRVQRCRRDCAANDSEVRTTKDERALIARAAAEQGSDLTEFVISNLTIAARHVLADQTEFGKAAPDLVVGWRRRSIDARPAIFRAFGSSWSVRRRSSTSERHLPLAGSPRRGDHVVDGFQCRSPEQTEWLRWHARQSTGTGTARVLVVTPAGSNVVVAYACAWCMASVVPAEAPPRVRKGAGRYQVLN